MQGQGQTRISTGSEFDLVLWRRFLSCLFGLLLCGAPAWPNFINVDTTDDEFAIVPAGSGCSLREAIEAANTDTAFGGCEAGLGADIIFIPQGTYTGTRLAPTMGPNDNSGGMLVVTESVLLVGLGDPRPIIEQGVVGERLFFVDEGVGEFALINLHLRNGQSNIAGGGAIFAFDSTALDIDDVLFENNASNGPGGAIYVAEDSDDPVDPDFLDLADVEFRLNSTVASGGAIYSNARVDPGEEVEVRCLRCVFDRNTALSNAGAIYLRGGAGGQLTATITDSQFVDNTAEVGTGGVRINGAATVLLEDTEMSGNRSLNDDIDSGLYVADSDVEVVGGVYEDPLVASGSTIDIRSALFENTEAGAVMEGLFASVIELRHSVVRSCGLPEDGSGVVSASEMIIEDTAFIGNEGGVDCNFCDLVMRRSSVVNGTGDHDGVGISLFGGIGGAHTAELTNVTVSGNQANGANGGGIAIFRGIDVTMNNVTVADNQAAEGGGLWVRHDANPPQIANSILADNTATVGGPNCFGEISSQGYNLIGNGSGCTTNSTTGDLVGGNTLPVFAQLQPLLILGGGLPTHGLQASSPAVDSGNPMTANGVGGACESVDALGIARPVDAGGGAFCDRGARERIVGTDGQIFADGFESGSTNAWQ